MPIQAEPAAVARVRRAERQQAIDVLVSAFVDDPFVRWLCPDDDAVRRFSSSLRARHWAT